MQCVSTVVPQCLDLILCVFVCLKDEFLIYFLFRFALPVGSRAWQKSVISIFIFKLWFILMASKGYPVLCPIQYKTIYFILLWTEYSPRKVIVGKKFFPHSQPMTIKRIDEQKSDPEKKEIHWQREHKTNKNWTKTNVFSNTLCSDFLESGEGRKSTDDVDSLKTN